MKSKKSAIVIVCLMALAFILWLLYLGPIAQNPEYHKFADIRCMGGLCRAGDVLTNIPFIIVGAWGLLYLYSAKSESAFENKFEKKYFVIFYIGLFLTGFGSSYYHVDPSSSTLFWDRLPLTLSFMSFLCITISERISPSFAEKIFIPTLLLGLFSVVYWHFTEQAGVGDLRFYYFVQFFTIFIIPIILILFKSRYKFGHYVWYIMAAYFGAKVTEIYDHEIYNAIKVLSGHNLKHLIAALSPVFILIMLKKRQVEKPSTEIMI